MFRLAPEESGLAQVLLRRGGEGSGEVHGLRILRAAPGLKFKISRIETKKRSSQNGSDRAPLQQKCEISCRPVALLRPKVSACANPDLHPARRSTVCPGPYC